MKRKNYWVRDIMLNIVKKNWNVSLTILIVMATLMVGFRAVLIRNDKQAKYRAEIKASAAKEQTEYFERLRSVYKTLDTYRDWVIVAGVENKSRLDLKSLSSEEAKNYEAKGLKNLNTSAREGNDFDQDTLAGYHYYFTQDYRKALFWAHEAAESGRSRSMCILFKAYATGTGSTVDCNEAAKWLILAVAMGDQQAKDALTELEEEAPASCREGTKRANAWIQTHQNLFHAPG